MKDYNVYRNSEIIGSEITASTPEDAIDQAQNEWSYENFGLAGALTERENYINDDWFDAEFSAVPVEEDAKTLTKEKEDERGMASIFITLEDSVITVYHGQDKVVLFEKKAHAGDWDKIWDAIRAK